jgi:hypothetical protein
MKKKAGIGMKKKYSRHRLGKHIKNQTLQRSIHGRSTPGKNHASMNAAF